MQLRRVLGHREEVRRIRFKLRGNIEGMLGF